MKRNLLILAFLLSSIAQANCQKEKNIRISEPEFSGTSVFVNDTIGKGILLEQQTATMEDHIVTLKYVVKVLLFFCFCRHNKLSIYCQGPG